MKRNLLFVIFLGISLWWFVPTASAIQDSSDDLSNQEVSQIVVSSVSFKNVKFASKRFEQQFPVRQGDQWNEEAKNKIIRFIKELEKDDVIESKNFDIIEKIKDNKLDLTIRVAEKLPFFAFAFPFYSTTKGFKAKIKYWNFYHNGYPMPLDAQVEYIAKEKLGIALSTDKPLKLTDNLKISFNLDSYTSTLNYLSTDYNWHADDWQSGIDDLSVKLNISVPKFGTEIQPAIGLGYGNLLRTKENYKIDNIIKQDHTTLATAKLRVKQPLDKKGSYFMTNLGFGFKNFVSIDTSDDINLVDNEFSLSLMGNDPTSIDDPLSKPVKLAQFCIALDKINSFFYTGLDAGIVQTPSASSSYNEMYLKDFSYSTFEDDILKNIKNLTDRAFVRNCYYKDTDDSKYKIQKGLSSITKQKIWDILIDSGIVASNGFLVKPSFSFDFAIGKTGLHIKPGAYFQWDLKYENSSLLTHQLIGGLTLGASYKVPVVDMLLKFSSDIRYAHKWSEITEFGEIVEVYDRFIIKDITFSAEKKFNMSNFYLDRRQVTAEVRENAGHVIKFEFHCEADPVAQWYENQLTSSYETNLKVMYQMYLPTFKSHRFKFRSLVFASFNNTIEKALDGDFVGDWMRGKGFDSLASYAGLILNFDYWIPLFTIDTTKFISKSMKKPMIWEVYWILYTDMMLGVTDSHTDVTIDRNLLHLLPALTVGTAFRVYPKFIPLIINVELSLNTYNLVKEKGSITSYLFFEFSIAHQLSNNWFYK